MNAGVVRLIGKHCLQYAVPPGHAFPEGLTCMSQLAPRRRTPPKDQRAEFALYTFTKSMAHACRRAVHHQVCIAHAL